MRNKILILFLFVFLITFVNSMPTCSDTNEIDISDIPCTGLTVPVSCVGNITAFNTTNPEINSTIPTSLFVDDVYNFTVNLTQGSYEFIDCDNNTATVIIGLFQQGYGVNMFGIIFPSILLSFLSLFFSGKIFKKFNHEDDEEREELTVENDEDSFVPKSRLIPIILMLFSFVPMIFMVGFVSSHLREYLPKANVTVFYGTFYILFSIVFYFVFLISLLVWVSSFIKKRRVMRGLDKIE